jgi:hypothetical protein
VKFRLLCTLGLSLGLIPAFALAADPTSGAPAPAPAQEPAPAPAVAAPAASSDIEDHQVLLDQLNARAEALAGNITALGHKIMLLRESVVAGSFGPTRVLISHTNDVGSSFSLTSVVYYLDGKEVFRKTVLDGQPELLRETELVNGPMKPGPHELRTEMVFSGNGGGLFSYLAGYKFNVASKYAFDVPEGRLTSIRAVAVWKDDVTLQPKDRLAVEYHKDVALGTSSGKEQ